jgi:crotonobetaine/carnitine-CoA ligase
MSARRLDGSRAASSSATIAELLGDGPVADTMAALFRYRVKFSPDAVGFRFEREDFTNVEIAILVERIRVSLRRDGLEHGDRVAAFMHNSPFLLALFLACSMEGIVFSPINVSLRRSDLAYSLRDLGAKSAFFDSELSETFLAAIEECPVGCTVEYGDGGKSKDAAAVDDWLLPYAGPGPEPAVLPTDPLCVIYSGGTTGLPKGIVIPQFGPVAAGIRYNTIAEFSGHETYFTTLQLYHSFAPLIALPFCLTYGHTFCFWKWWSASRFVDMVAHYGATISDPFIGMIATLMQTPPRDQDLLLGGVRVVAGLGGLDDGGMRLRASFEARFGAKTFDLYGFTESNGLVAFEREADARKLGSCGTVSPWFDVMVAGPDDMPLAPGEKGQILVRPLVPNTIGLGYLNKSEVTAKAWRNLWIHTGDLGYFDDDGYLFYVGRSDHFLRRRGELVSAAEVEAVLMGYPGIVEVAVVAAPSEFGEDEVRACVVTSEPDFDPRHLHSYVRDLIAPFKVPRYIDLLDALPRTGAKREIEKFRLQKRSLDHAWDATRPERSLPKTSNS